MSIDLELKERIYKLSDDQLLRMVNIEFVHYRAAAIKYAIAEIKTRGLSRDNHLIETGLTETTGFSLQEKLRYKRERTSLSVILFLIVYGLYSLVDQSSRSGTHALLSFLALLGIIYTVNERKKEKNGKIAKDARSVLLKDERPSIVYLRSFVQDQIEGQDIGQDRDTFEELLEKATKKIGPLIALGNNADEITPFGAARVYVEGNWQQVVKLFLNGAQAVFIQVGESDGLIWEIQCVVSNLKPERVFLSLPIDMGQTEYNGFREKTMSIFPRRLPKLIGEAKFIYFDKEWNPYCLVPQDLHLWKKQPSTKLFFRSFSQTDPEQEEQLKILEALNRGFKL